MEQSVCLIGGVQPLQLPWKLNPLNKDGIGSARGIALSVGNPEQFFSMKPAIYQNNTAMVNVNACVSASNYSCVVGFHGVYNPPTGVDSTTQIASWNGTRGVDISSPGIDYVFFNDVFDIGGREIPGVPFYTYDWRSNGAVLGSGLAIGQNSSLTESMLDAHAIPNQGWSLWPGLQYNSIDGLMIMGGYDKDRVAGNFEEFTVANGGQLQIEITDLKWEPSIGTPVDLMPNGKTQIIGSLESYYERCGLPADSYNKFYEATNGTSIQDGYHYWSVAPIGNLSFTLSNGMVAKIPSEELFYRPYDYDNRGVENITSYAYYDVALWPDNMETGVLAVGMPYLAQYLLVTDFEQGKFWMADAVKTAAGQTATNVMPLCTGGPTFSSNSSNNSTSQPVPSHTNVAAIAGGVGGGVGALLIAAIAFCLYRRRSKNKQKQELSQPSPVVQQAPGMVHYDSNHGSPPPKYPVIYEMDKGQDGGLSPHGSSFGSPPGSPNFNQNYVPYTRVYDPNNHELAGSDVGSPPNRYKTVSPVPLEMPTNHHN